MVRPYNKPYEANRHHSVRHSQITKNGLSGKSRDHVAYDTESWEDHDVNLWVAEEPEQMQKQYGVSTT